MPKDMFALKEDEKFNLKTVSINDSVQITRSIEEEDVNTLLKISGDNNPLHTDETFAKRTIFKGRIVHGIFALSLISSGLTRLMGPGNVWLNQTFTFKSPIRINDTLTATLTILKITKSKVLIVETIVKNQKGEIILEGEASSKVFTIKSIKEQN